MGRITFPVNYDIFKAIFGLPAETKIRDVRRSIRPGFFDVEADVPDDDGKVIQGQVEPRYTVLTFGSPLFLFQGFSEPEDKKEEST
jgi:hypothetical protein